MVGRDERENGGRALLNLGHTFGHAIESLTGYGAGCMARPWVAGCAWRPTFRPQLGLIGADAVDTIKSAVARAGLPVRIPGISLTAAFAAMRTDKKAYAGQDRFRRSRAHRAGGSAPGGRRAGRGDASRWRLRVMLDRESDLAPFAARSSRSPGPAGRRAAAAFALAVPARPRPDRPFDGISPPRYKTQVLSITRATCFARA